MIRRKLMFIAACFLASAIAVPLVSHGDTPSAHIDLTPTVSAAP